MTRPRRPRRRNGARGSGASAGRFVTTADARTFDQPWGRHWVLSEPAVTGSSSLMLVRVRMAPGTGHAFHTHPENDEIIYVIDGVAEQWVNRDKRRLKAGDSAYIPKGVVHGTYNTTNRPLTFLAILSPASSQGPFVVDCQNDAPWRRLRPQRATRPLQLQLEGPTFRSARRRRRKPPGLT